ncbi:MAG TPA: acyl-CoA dehydrogenase family protein [Acidimicrobiia bacterium]|nr:acyl-CoA dehydrogenase family protein [Acidimicrobiia bacterium]
MDFRYPPEAEAFRAEFRAWLDANLPGDLRGAGSAGTGELGPGALERHRAWDRMLADARYAAIAWPEEWGGRGAGVMQQVVYAEEMHRAQAPGSLNTLGLSNIAPAIIEHGTDEQKRALLPRMLRSDDLWCQGFSEPDAGSDLASLRTSAVRDGDDWVVNGQKTWNTYGNRANWCELLVRTDPDAPKHKGITCLLVDMTSPGVEVRPLATITGEQDFNEIYFTDVRVPLANTLGPVNEGWRVAMTTLAYERGTVAKLHLGTRARIRRLIDDAKTTPFGDGQVATDDPIVRHRLARLYMEGELLKLISDRAISAELHGRAMGPEGSLAKLLWSETEQHIGEMAAEVLGPDALAGPWARDRVYGRSFTIAGGTTQVNKNIIAQRILGLPRA